jgi:CRISPR-associated protein Cas1
VAKFFKIDDKENPMTILYIREQGAVVRRDGERVVVTKQQARSRQVERLEQLPVRELDQVVIYGNVQVTTQAVALLLAHEIDIVFLTLYGKYLGGTQGSGSKHARLRHAQLRLSGNERASLAVAKRIIQAKLANQRNLLQEIAPSSDPPVAARLAAAAQGIEQMRRECLRAGTLDGLRGFEGKAGAFYFGAIRHLLHPSWLFQGRIFRPPPDPFNALLSFGYTHLCKDVTTTLHLVGLDPYLGCFHALEDNRPSLALDLMEEFRPLAVDRPVLALAAAGKIKPGDFTYTGQGDRPVELGPALIPLWVAAYEERMAQVVLHTPSGQQNTLRRCLELQARLFARVVMGERQEYEGLVG